MTRADARVEARVEARPATKAARTRQRILDAAATTLAERGYHGTSLPLVAERLGMQSASLYYHFASKDELVLEVLRLGTVAVRDAVVDAIAHLGDDPDPVVVLRTAIVAHSVAILAQGPYTRANVRSYGQLPPELATRHRGEQRAYGALWRGIVERAAAAGALRHDLDPRAARLLILGAMNWSIEWFDADDDLTAAELGEQLAAMLLHCTI